MPIRIPWDNFEISLMFEVYQRMKAGLPLKDAAQILSDQLRSKAVNQGLEIDNVFRNTNGMVFYLKRTEFLFTDGKAGLGGAQKNVVDMYEIYQKNPVQYQDILCQAQKLAGLVEASDTKGKDVTVVNECSKEIEVLFRSWLSSHITSAQLSMRYPTFKMTDEFCRSRGILRNSIFETIDVTVLNKAFASLQGNKVFKRKYRSQIALTALRDYISFVKAEQPQLQALMNGEHTPTQNRTEEKHSNSAGSEGTIQIEQEANTSDNVPVTGEVVLGESPVKMKEERGDPINTFRQWMQNKGMSERTSVVYASALRQCARFALKKGYTSTDFYQMNNSEDVIKCRSLLMQDPEFQALNTRRSNQLSACLSKYSDYLHDRSSCEIEDDAPLLPITIDPRWKEILEKDFPDGYILNDFLCQFQAAGMWQERFGEVCPLDGEAIDEIMSACGSIKDGRVFISNGDEGQLLQEIAQQVADILNTYSNVYTSKVYQKYRDALMALSIYTEKVMAQQVLKHANNRFVLSYNAFFTKYGDSSTVAQDCERVLQRQGGAMSVQDIANELWFIPYDTVYHSLSVNDRCLNVGTGTWMLVEHFPLTREDTLVIAKMLTECFLSKEYILNSELIPLIQKNLPHIAANISDLNAGALFNIVEYYLCDQFSFSKSIISPRGKVIDNRVLFRRFSADRDRFFLEELDAFACELSTPIYWESTLAGGAVRISHNEFVNRSQIHFDIDAIDAVLESICPGNYLSFYQVPKGMMVLLPSCGYPWNGYLLSSFVYGFSKVFYMQYNSLGKTGYYGAMVRRSCRELDTYEHLIEQVLTDDNSWNTQAEALNLIVNQGYQATRKLKGIENMIANAKNNKLADGR